MTTQSLYDNYIQNNISKDKFLYEIRRNNTPHITKFNSLEDTIKILKNKGVICEKKELIGKYKADKNPIFNKNEFEDIDQVDPYEFKRGINYELGLDNISVGLNLPNNESYESAKKKVLKNLKIDSYWYSNKKRTPEQKEIDKSSLKYIELKQDFTAPNQLKKVKQIKESVLNELGGNEYFQAIDNEDFDMIDKSAIYNFLRHKFPHLDEDDADYYANEYCQKHELPPYDGDDFHFKNYNENLDQYYSQDDESGIGSCGCEEKDEILRRLGLTPEDLEDEDIAAEVDIELARQSLSEVKVVSGTGRLSMDYEIDDEEDNYKIISISKNDKTWYGQESNGILKIEFLFEDDEEDDEIEKSMFYSLKSLLNKYNTKYNVKEQGDGLIFINIKKSDIDLNIINDDLDEALALKDKSGNVQYAKDDSEAISIITQARTKGVNLTKSNV